MLAAYVDGGTEEAKVFTFANKNKVEELRVGQEVTISLVGNITTGYSWLREDDDDGAIVSVGAIEYKSDAHSSQIAGSGGVFIAKYRAMKTGKATVILEYRRPWEKDRAVTEDQIFRLTFVVRE